jgi:hypothetical protein
MTNESQIPFERRHVRTGQPRGGRPGNTNAWKTGWRSRVLVERRRAFMQLLKACREAAKAGR